MLRQPYAACMRCKYLLDNEFNEILVEFEKLLRKNVHKPLSDDEGFCGAKQVMT